jgi:hypothetical protein
MRILRFKPNTNIKYRTYKCLLKKLKYSIKSRRIIKEFKRFFIKKSINKSKTLVGKKNVKLKNKRT